jgi:ribosomal protein S18 acetylase RimI-like enzyme
MIANAELLYKIQPAVKSIKGEHKIMSEQKEKLYRLEKNDVLKADAVLTDAFRHDPLWNRVLAKSKADQQTGLFEVPIRYCLRYGEVYATSENLEGIITWVPGDLADMPIWQLIRSGAIWSGLKMAIQLYSKLGPVFKPIEHDRKENMKGSPFIYLPAIGVASEFQGQGFGGKLLCALIAESEQARIPLYLETESEGNVRWYERFGFESVKQINLPVINLPMWEMARKP